MHWIKQTPTLNIVILQSRYFSLFLHRDSLKHQKFFDPVWSCQTHQWWSILRKYLATSTHELFLQEICTIDVWEGLIYLFRSSRLEVFCKKDALRNFAKFSGKHLCQSLFFNKVADLRPETLSKKSIWYSCFPVSFVEFVRTPFLQSTSNGCFYVFEECTL